VLTVGYPMGGENICVTRGVVPWWMTFLWGANIKAFWEVFFLFIIISLNGFDMV
jgi:hypothetical protein